MECGDSSAASALTSWVESHNRGQSSVNAVSCWAFHWELHPMLGNTTPQRVLPMTNEAVISVGNEEANPLGPSFLPQIQIGPE